MDVLNALVEALATGAVRVVDLTQTLGPATPVIRLPPMFAPSPGVTIQEISCYDQRGPAWYWNTLHLRRTYRHALRRADPLDHRQGSAGERLQHHSGAQFRRPGVRHRCHAPTSRRNPDFLLTADRIEQWEREHGRIPAGAWVLLRTGWSTRTDREAISSTSRPTARTAPGSMRARRGCWPASATSSASAWRPSAPMPARPARSTRRFPNHTIMHGAGKFGLASLCNLDRLPPTGAIVIAAPLKIVRGSGSPLRVHRAGTGR